MLLQICIFFKLDARSSVFKKHGRTCVVTPGYNRCALLLACTRDDGKVRPKDECDCMNLSEGL